MRIMDKFPNRDGSTTFVPREATPEEEEKILRERAVLWESIRSKQDPSLPFQVTAEMTDAERYAVGDAADREIDFLKKGTKLGFTRAEFFG